MAVKKRARTTKVPIRSGTATGRKKMRASGTGTRTVAKGAKKTARRSAKKNSVKKVRGDKKSLLHREIFTPLSRKTMKRSRSGSGTSPESRAHSVRERAMLQSCAKTLRSVMIACNPRSFAGSLSIFLCGMLAGFITLIGFMYMSKNEMLLRFLVADGVSVLDGVPVRIEEEVDYSFSSEPSFPRVPEDFSDVEMTTFWDAWRLIESEFVPKPERRENGEGVVEKIAGETPNRDELLYGAIEGLAKATGDPYTNFFSPRHAKEFEEEVLQGEIDGIGAYISFEDDFLTIIGVIENGPAFHAGLKDGDVIKTIDGVSSDEYNLTEAAYAIRGARNTGVSLGIYRESDNNEFDVTVIRDRVEIPTVEYEIIDGVFVIRLLTFTRQTPDAFRNALREFVRVANAGGPDRILLDMRGNVGGVMSVAVSVAGEFLPAESVVLYEYRGDENLRSFKTVRPAFKNGVLPVMTVLVDGGSASSSEIVAAALRHYGVADIVGLPTLGKGSVQTLREIGDEQSLLKMTVAHWLTPDKTSVEKNSIKPDVTYEEDVKALLEENADADTEAYILSRAIEHVKNK